MSATLSGATCVLAFLLAARVFGQWRARRRAHQLAWTAALALFGIAAAAQLVASVIGWSAVAYRIWYLSGALLAAAWLGQGTVLLLLPRRAGRLLTAVLLAGSVAGGVAVLLAPVDLVIATQGGVASGRGFPDATRLLTPLFNVYGTGALLIGAGLGVWRWAWSGGDGRRAVGTGLIGMGAILVGLGGTLTRLGLPGILYLSEMLGIAMIFGGFALTDTVRGGPRTVRPAAWLEARRGRVRAFGVAFGVLGIFGALAALPILPWTMGIVTDVKYSYTSDVPADNEGAYLVTADGAMQLYSWEVEPDEFPPDAPSMPLDAVRDIVVVQKVFDSVSKYQLYNLDTEVQISWASTTQHATELTLHPEELPGGEYVLVVPSSGMFGGESLNYFRVL